MDWRGIATLSLAGPFIGMLTSFGVFRGFWELVAWIAVGFGFWIPGLVRRRMPRPVLAGVLVGVAAGLVAALLQAFMLAAYLHNNPTFARETADFSDPQRRLMLLAAGACFGFAFGLVVGLAAKLVLRLRGAEDVPAVALAASGGTVVQEDGDAPEADGLERP